MAVEQGDKFQFPDEKGEDGEKKAPKFTFVIEGEEGDDEGKKADGDGVAIVDDTSEADRNQQKLKEFVEPTEEELKQYSANVQSRIKNLAHARHDERREKEAAQREAEEAARLARQVLDENRRLKQYVESGTKAFAETSKAAALSELAVAEQEFKAAHEAYDTEALLAAQKKLNAAQMKLAAAENFKAPPLQAEKEGVERQATLQEPPKPDEKAVRWQARNQWFGVDDEMTALALAVHKKLVGKGVDPRTDEYFAQLDARMHEKFPEVFGESRSPGESKTPRKSAPVVAPTARSGGSKQIRLTQTQVALAKKLGLTNEQYAASVAQLEQQNGR